MSDKLDARLNALTYHRPTAEVQAIMTRLRESYDVCRLIKEGE